MAIEHSAETELIARLWMERYIAGEGLCISLCKIEQLFEKADELLSVFPELGDFFAELWKSIACLYEVKDNIREGQFEGDAYKHCLINGIIPDTSYWMIRLWNDSKP